MADDLTIIVTDDGRGIDREAVPCRLTDLRRRAEKAGGRFQVGSLAAPDTGTRLYWSVPLR